jgi:hypothetical protein
MRIIQVKPYQSIFDIALQEFGRAEAALDIVLANGISINDDLYTGQSLIMPEDVEAIEDLVQYIADRNIVIATDKRYDYELEYPPLSLRLVDLVNEDKGADGYIGIEVKGGKKPYTFSWSDGEGMEIATSQNLNNVTSGSYSVTVLDADSNQAQLTNLVIAIADTNVYLVDEFGNILTDENGQPLTA